jgi:hypothetical protein
VAHPDSTVTETAVVNASVERFIELIAFLLSTQVKITYRSHVGDATLYMSMTTEKLLNYHYTLNFCGRPKTQTPLPCLRQMRRPHPLHLATAFRCRGISQTHPAGRISRKRAGNGTDFSAAKSIHTT